MLPGQSLFLSQFYPFYCIYGDIYRAHGCDIIIHTRLFKKTKQGGLPMNTIYPDVFLQICTKLDAKSISRLGRTSKTILSLANQDSIWENLAKRTISNPLPNLSKSWKLYYKEFGNVRFMIETKDLAKKTYKFPVCIDMNNKLITFHQKNKCAYYIDKKFLDEVFKRITGSFTLIQRCKTGDGYYYRDANQAENSKNLNQTEISNLKDDFHWSDARIQTLWISTSVNLSSAKMEQNQNWKKHFEHLQKRGDTKNFRFSIK